ncbi:HD domain-containing protein [Xanthocytophaga agilis]|uniref:HD domain-containing protein n=1 Tax=Xanthocytophaga agilis TaxID=3048010 RepID=A0AAE3R5X3_9BACT|nr:HD domain-containing protein [Xanthocytophaga agilis]MDJ1502054.1 HD domain-containing protein [Xanthocytophaga agilis]
MQFDYRDNYYGSILDPLHGDIKLSEIEKWCISQPIFSRLRKIKQNTFLYYVFPSANHTRFEHSIGVMHLAGKIFDSCKENYATGNKKQEKYSLQTNPNFFDLNTLQGQEQVYYQELRLAALLHDIGHGPMSHLFDEFSISKEAFLKIVDGDKQLQKYKVGFENLIDKNNGKVEHEVISCAFIFYLIDKMKNVYIHTPQKFSNSSQYVVDSLSSERIVKMIEPKFEGLEDIKHNDLVYTEFFSKIVTGFPIDADRMDYLLRDSYFSGVTYGVYDINRIFASFLAYKNKKNEVDLCFKESGLESMLRFIQSRSHLYNQVYFHKTNRAANTMLTYGTRPTCSCGTKSKLLDECENLEKLLEFYTINSDEYFLNRTVKKQLAQSMTQKKVIEELVNRKLFKRVYQKKIVLGVYSDKELETRKIKEIRQKIDNQLNSLFELDNICAVSDYYENFTFKEADSKSITLAKKKNKKYEFIEDWKKAGKEFAILDITVGVLRIYLRRTFKDSDEFQTFEERIRAVLRQEIEDLEKYED